MDNGLEKRTSKEGRILDIRILGSDCKSGRNGEDFTKAVAVGRDRRVCIFKIFDRNN